MVFAGDLLSPSVLSDLFQGRQVGRRRLRGKGLEGGFVVFFVFNVFDLCVFLI